MRVRRANLEDLSAVNALLASYGIRTITDACFNSTDLSLVAVDKEQVIGFIFAGRFCKGTRAYVDHFVVSKDYHRKGVGYRLAKKLFKVGMLKGVESYFAHITHDEYHDASAMNCLRHAMGSNGRTYTLVEGFMQTAKQELGLA